MIKQKIIFRADGNSTIGLGHISRCLALAEILSKNYIICFAVQLPDETLLEDLKKTAHEVIVLQQLNPSHPLFSQELQPYLTGEELIVLDGYYFGIDYEAALKKSGHAVVSIDDIPARHFVSDVIFNFCGALSKEDYSREFYTQVFVGLEYLFLRWPFLRKHPAKRQQDERLFLNMGGADSSNETLKILHELVALNYSRKIDVVVGNSYTHLASLETLRGSMKSIAIYQGLDAAEMYNVMSNCTIAILPPSTVALEFLSTGGFLFLHQTAINQALQKKYLVSTGFAAEFTDFKLIVIDKAMNRSQLTVGTQENFFDGSSLVRVERIFENLHLSSKLILRSIAANDAKQSFEWANDPLARKYSYSPAAILWEEHINWFTRKLNDERCYYFIAEIDHNPVGQIRFDFVEGEHAYQISYALDARWRNKGLGLSLLIKGIQKLIQAAPPIKVIGYVQQSNSASVNAFQKAGFEKTTSKKYPDSFKFELLLTTP